MMDWELMSEQVVRHVEECLPRDSTLSFITRSNAEEPSTAQESSTGDAPPLALEKNGWGEPSRDRRHMEDHMCARMTTIIGQSKHVAVLDEGFEERECTVDTDEPESTGIECLHKQAQVSHLGYW